MASLNVISLMLYIDEIRLILPKLGLISVLPNELVNVVGYDIIRCDRNISGVGSVYIKNDINYSNCQKVLDNVNREILKKSRQGLWHHR